MTGAENGRTASVNVRHGNEQEENIDVNFIAGNFASGLNFKTRQKT